MALRVLRIALSVLCLYPAAIFSYAVKFFLSFR
jgi:hypothetical protein